MCVLDFNRGEGMNERVLRGNSRGYGERDCRLALRDGNHPAVRLLNGGFRVLRASYKKRRETNRNKGVRNLLRGGSWRVTPGICRSVGLNEFLWEYRVSLRGPIDTGSRDDDIGFRVVRVSKTPFEKRRER